MRYNAFFFHLFVIILCGAMATKDVNAQGKKPNILVIMGDDIGWFNPSCYNRGMMRYSTPNIDRIAREGALFNSWYGQQSCTAGRAAFVTGQSPIRTGLTKVGMPGADVGLQKERHRELAGQRQRRAGRMADPVPVDPAVRGQPGRDLERGLERGGVAALLDGDDGLTRDADPAGELLLGHLAVLEPEHPDRVRDLRGLRHRRPAGTGRLGCV